MAQEILINEDTDTVLLLIGYGRSSFFRCFIATNVLSEFNAGITTSAGASVGAHVMQMQTDGGVRPYVGLRVRGSLAVGNILYGKLELTGYICQIALPSNAALKFSKFPLDLR